MRKLLVLFTLFILALPLAAQYTDEEIVLFTAEDLGDMAQEAAERFAAHATAFWNDRNTAMYSSTARDWGRNFWKGQLAPIPIPPYKVACSVNRVVFATDEIGRPSYAWAAQGGIAGSCDIAEPAEFVTPMHQPTQDDLRRMTSAQLEILGLEAPPPPPAGNCRVGPEFWAGAGQFAALPEDTCPEGQVITHQGWQLVKICFVTPFAKVCKYAKQNGGQ